MPYSRDEIKGMLREVLDEGKGYGQSSWASTSQALLTNLSKVSNDVLTVGKCRFHAEGDTAQYVVEARVPGKIWYKGENPHPLGYERLTLRTVPADHPWAKLPVVGEHP